MKSKTAELQPLEDRRLVLRQRCSVETLAFEHARMGVVTAEVLEMNLDGFCLRMPCSIPCGDGILIHPPAGTDLLKIWGKVVRQSICAYGDKNIVECGVEVADTPAWREHNWFLTLDMETGGAEAEEAADVFSEPAA